MVNPQCQVRLGTNPPSGTLRCRVCRERTQQKKVIFQPYQLPFSASVKSWLLKMKRLARAGNNWVIDMDWLSWCKKTHNGAQLWVPLSSGLSILLTRNSGEILPKETCVACKSDRVVIVSCRSVIRYLMHNGLKVHIYSCYFTDNVYIKYVFLMS